MRPLLPGRSARSDGGSVCRARLRQRTGRQADRQTRTVSQTLARVFEEEAWIGCSFGKGVSTQTTAGQYVVSRAKCLGFKSSEPGSRTCSDCAEREKWVESFGAILRASTSDVAALEPFTGSQLDANRSSGRGAVLGPNRIFPKSCCRRREAENGQWFAPHASPKGPFCDALGRRASPRRASQ